VAGPGSAMERQPDGAAADVEVEFIDADGTRRREPLSGCWNVTFERVAPVRGFALFRGQRNRPGLWWFATTGEHVGHESWLERDRLMALDADPEVVGVAAQPMWLRWRAESGRWVRHAPDYFARRADGTGVVIDVRADRRIGDQDAAVFAATARLCAQAGWDYQRAGELGPVHAANLRWLSGYRHPRFARPELAARLGEVFAAPGPLLGGAAAAGDPVAVLPVLFGMLWRGELAAELKAGLLGPATLVRARGCCAAGRGSHHAQFIDVLHRQHAIVEDGVRAAKSMGLRNLPSKTWQVNCGWVLAANIAADLTAWCRLLGLHDQHDLKDAEPDTLRYRLLSLPARLVRHARARVLKISRTWPWKDAFLACWQRLCALPAPA
jgi:Transposase DDE domain group 1